MLDYRRPGVGQAVTTITGAQAGSRAVSLPIAAGVGPVAQKSKPPHKAAVRKSGEKPANQSFSSAPAAVENLSKDSASSATVDVSTADDIK